MILAAVTIAAYAVLSTAGLLLLKTGLDTDAALPTLVANPRLLGGALLYATSFAVWIMALRRYELSTVYPLFIGIGYTAVVVASSVVLDESLSRMNIVGIVFIGFGVFFVLR